MNNTFKITAFYKFLKLHAADLPRIQSSLESLARENEISGLIILAEEGVNGTIAGPPIGIDRFKANLPEVLNCDSVLFKDSWAAKDPFNRFKIKLRDEIVTIGDPNLFPEQRVNHHLSPEEWNKVLKEEDVLILDTRNFYETAVGLFENAVDPNISSFNEFPAYLDQANIPKNKKVLMYCTGGIRCEKAILEMQRRGYQNVYQLEGGILKYLEQFPNGAFKGECFVFDHRVAVDSNLQPTKNYHLCAQCGDPGNVTCTCPYCEGPAKVCQKCASTDSGKACSKNCAYHVERLKTSQNISSTA